MYEKNVVEIVAGILCPVDMGIVHAESAIDARYPQRAGNRERRIERGMINCRLTLRKVQILEREQARIGRNAARMRSDGYTSPGESGYGSIDSNTWPAGTSGD